MYAILSLVRSVYTCCWVYVAGDRWPLLARNAADVRVKIPQSYPLVCRGDCADLSSVCQSDCHSSRDADVSPRVSATSCRYLSIVGMYVSLRGLLPSESYR